MPRCPSCDSARVIIVLKSTRRGLCPACGTRWIQDGDTQRHVEGAMTPQRTGAR